MKIVPVKQSWVSGRPQWFNEYLYNPCFIGGGGTQRKGDRRKVQPHNYVGDGHDRGYNNASTICYLHQILYKYLSDATKMLISSCYPLPQNPSRPTQRDQTASKKPRFGLLNHRSIITRVGVRKRAQLKKIMIICIQYWNRRGFMDE
jgi:hypothetical protein